METTSPNFCRQHNTPIFRVLSKHKTRDGMKKYYFKHEEWLDRITYRFCTGDGIWKTRKQGFISKEAEAFMLMGKKKAH